MTTHQTTLEQSKAELIDKAISLAQAGKGTGGPPHDQVAELVRAYYRHVAPEDLLDRSDVDVYGAFAAHYKLATSRPQGTAQVRVATPTLAEHGWSASGHSVVEVVVDDMPFLVDSLTMELSRQLRDVHVVIHPSFDAVRDITGALQSVRSVPDGALDPEGEAVRESWMHVEIDRLPEGDDPDAIVEDIQRVLRDVREAVEDWRKMHAEVDAIVADLRSDPPPLDPEEVRQAAELLEWLANEHFTFLGYREYKLEERDGDDYLLAVPGTGLGILRADQEMSESFGRLPDAVKAKAREKTLLVLAKANSRATVHRPAYLDYVGVKTFDENGEVDGERRFLGLLASAAYTESLMRIPLIREKTKEVLKRSGFDPRSHAGKALMDTLETYPRDELLHTPIDELAPMTEAAMNARERRAVRMFIRRDTYGRYVSVLVYLPRDRYNTGVRERFERILQEQLRGESIEFTVRINESTTARVHFVVHLPKGDQIPDVDTADLERRLTEASRSWRDDFVQAVIAEYGEEVGTILGRRYAESFPEAYKEDFSARTASVDLGRLEAIRTDGPHDGGLDLSLYEHLDAGPGEARLKVYRIGVPLSLSKVLPMLSSMGVEVVDERPYALEGLERESMIYEFGLRYGEQLPSGSRELFQDALRAVWDGYNEIDGFNGLVLSAGLTWRQATVLRAYAKYMRQGNSPFAQDYIEDALRGNVDITRHLVALFEARFDPQRDDQRGGGSAEEEIERRILAALDDVASLDHDRILRSYLTHIKATLRTNYFQPARPDEGGAGGPHTYMSFKLEPSAIPDLPQPRPKFEIFVYSPRVEGVHLRFGPVARGGLRWSDRRDDFRTEVLGLVKAQMVKNTVIVPVGAKGGFFCKQLPDSVRPGRVAGRGRGLLQDLHLRAARHHRQPGRRRDRAARGRASPRRRRLLPGGRGRQGHGDVLGHRERRLAGLRLLAGRRVRQRWLGRLRPQGDGHHRPRCVGLGAAALPRARDRLPDRGVHRGRHRRHERRRVRQRAAVLRDHQAGRGVRPPRHLPRPRAGRRDVVRRAPAALRPAPLELAGLRQEPDLRGWRCLPALAQVGPAQRCGPRGPGHPRVGAGHDPGRADEGDPPGAGRPPVERRHRHLRQGRG